MRKHREELGGRRKLGLRLPKSVGGLIEATRRQACGNSRPLEVWFRKRYPMLREALGAWTGDSHLADHLASRVVTAAWEAVEAGGDSRIRVEIPWMVGVAQRARARAWRDGRSIGAPLPPDLLAPTLNPLELAIRGEDRESVVRLIAVLPERHGFAVTLRYLRHLTEVEVAAVFERSFGVGFERVRQVLKEGREMLRAGLEGRDPRVVWPGRYRRTTNRSSFLPVDPRCWKLHG